MQRRIRAMRLQDYQRRHSTITQEVLEVIVCDYGKASEEGAFWIEQQAKEGPLCENERIDCGLR